MIPNLKKVCIFLVLVHLGQMGYSQEEALVPIESFTQSSTNWKKIVGLQATHDFGNSVFYIDPGILRTSKGTFVDPQKVGGISWPQDLVMYSSKKGQVKDWKTLAPITGGDLGTLDFYPLDENRGTFARVTYGDSNRRALYPENAQISVVWRDTKQKFDGVTAYSIERGNISEIIQCHESLGYCSAANLKICNAIMEHARKVTRKKNISLKEIIDSNRLCNAFNTWEPTSDFQKEVKRISEKLLSHAERLAKDPVEQEGTGLTFKKGSFNLRKPQHPEGFLTTQNNEKTIAYHVTKNWLDTLGMCSSFVEKDSPPQNEEISKTIGPRGQTESSQ